MLGFHHQQCLIWFISRFEDKTWNVQLKMKMLLFTHLMSSVQRRIFEELLQGSFSYRNTVWKTMIMSENLCYSFQIAYSLLQLSTYSVSVMTCNNHWGFRNKDVKLCVTFGWRLSISVCCTTSEHTECSMSVVQNPFMVFCNRCNWNNLWVCK